MYILREGYLVSATVQRCLGIIVESDVAFDGPAMRPAMLNLGPSTFRDCTRKCRPEPCETRYDLV